MFTNMHNFVTIKKVMQVEANLRREIILQHYEHPKNRGLLVDDTYIKE